LQVYVRRAGDFKIVPEGGREPLPCPKCGKYSGAVLRVFEQLVEKGPDGKVHEYVRDGAGRMVLVPPGAEEWPGRELVPEHLRV
jgi:hypothetical protein